MSHNYLIINDYSFVSVNNIYVNITIYLFTYIAIKAVKWRSFPNVLDVCLIYRSTLKNSALHCLFHHNYYLLMTDISLSIIAGKVPASR